MLLRSLALAGLVALVAPMMTGCGVIYSKQTYGSPEYHRLTSGATKSDMFANFGQPSAVYEAEGGDVFIYQSNLGSNFLGLVSSLRRVDTVVLVDDNGVVQHVGEVTMGKGMTILSGPFTDATHPVRTSVLQQGPQNYSYEATYEETAK